MRTVILIASLFIVQPPAPDQATDASLKEARSILQIIGRFDNTPSGGQLAPLRERLAKKAGDGDTIAWIIKRYLEDWTAGPKTPTETQKRVFEAGWRKSGRQAAIASLKEYIKELEKTMPSADPTS